MCKLVEGMVQHSETLSSAFGDQRPGVFDVFDVAAS